MSFERPSGFKFCEGSDQESGTYDGTNDCDLLSHDLHWMNFDKCTPAGTILGASLGYAGAIEAVLTIILVKILLGAGCIKKDGDVTLNEYTKTEIQKMIDASKDGETKDV